MTIKDNRTDSSMMPVEQTLSPPLVGRTDNIGVVSPIGLPRKDPCIDVIGENNYVNRSIWQMQHALTSTPSDEFTCINNNNNSKYNTQMTPLGDRHRKLTVDIHRNGYEQNGNVDYNHSVSQDLSSPPTSNCIRGGMGKQSSPMTVVNGNMDSSIDERFRRRSSTSACRYKPEVTSSPTSDKSVLEGKTNGSPSGLSYADMAPLFGSPTGHHPNEYAIHDGFATLTRSKRTTNNHNYKPLSNGQLSPRLNASQPHRTVFFPKEEPLSLNFDAKILRLLEASQNGVIRTAKSQTNLSQTMPVLPQHGLEIHYAKNIYLTSKSLSESPSCHLERQHSLYSREQQHISSPVASPESLDSPQFESQSSKSDLFARMSSRFGSLRRPKKSQSNESNEEELQIGRKRSNSTPNIMDDICPINSDDDEDNDDYGFLSYPSFRANLGSTSKSVDNSPCAGMRNEGESKDTQLTQSQPSTGLLSKKWRKSKTPAPTKTSTWKPQGGCVWTKPCGKIVLNSTHMVHLTDAERSVLKKLAVSKLENLELGCSITVPKDHGHKRSKRGFSLRKKNLSTGLLEGLKEKTKDSKDGSSGYVFGIPLSKVIANDTRLERRRLLRVKDRKGSLDVTAERPRNSSTSSVGNISSDSLSESNDSRSTGSTLLEALSLSSSGRADSSKPEVDTRLAANVPHIPYILDTCFKHIETHGVHVTGIFRIGSSKKRVKQLREEFESGESVVLTDDYSPHDVGGLLKEFLRDLADPLLTRDLYSAFLATTKLKDQLELVNALRLLVALLPVANRDTLYALLCFLNIIVRHSEDQNDCHGHEIPGNKMDSNNLATLFGPNILHKAKGREFEVESRERLEERGHVIAAVKALIDNYLVIFEMPAELYDDVLRTLLETEPEAIDILLKRKLCTSEYENEGETSRVYVANSREAVTSQTLHNSNAKYHTQASNHRKITSQNSTTENHIEVISNHNEQIQDRQQKHNVLVHDTDQTQSIVMRNRVYSSAERQDNKQIQESKATQRMSTPEYFVRTSKSAVSVENRKTPVPQNLQIRITPESSRIDAKLLNIPNLSSILQTPHSSHKVSSQKTIDPPQDSQGGNKLTVPTFRDAKERASNSSLSSGYFGSSSRSGTTSPTTATTPDSPSQNWYLDTPPDSPPPVRPTNPRLAVDFPRETPPLSFQRTSSLQRPLGITPIVNISNSPLPPPYHGGTLTSGNGSHDRQRLTGNRPDFQRSVSVAESTQRQAAPLPEWQRERWRHWEEVARSRGDKLQEQETLV